MKTFTIENKIVSAEREGLTAEKLIVLSGKSSEGVCGVRQYFVDGERQRFWPVGWNEEVDSLEDGDRFELLMGDLINKGD